MAYGQSDPTAYRQWEMPQEVPERKDIDFSSMDMVSLANGLDEKTIVSLKESEAQDLARRMARVPEAEEILKRRGVHKPLTYMGSGMPSLVERAQKQWGDRGMSFAQEMVLGLSNPAVEFLLDVGFTIDAIKAAAKGEGHPGVAMMGMGMVLLPFTGPVRTFYKNQVAEAVLRAGADADFDLIARDALDRTLREHPEAIPVYREQLEETLSDPALNAAQREALEESSQVVTEVEKTALARPEVADFTPTPYGRQAGSSVLKKVEGADAIKANRNNAAANALLKHDWTYDPDIPMGASAVHKAGTEVVPRTPPTRVKSEEWHLARAENAKRHAEWEAGRVAREEARAAERALAGKPHDTAENVVHGGDGSFEPADGWEWKNPESGYDDLEVVRIGAADVTPPPVAMPTAGAAEAAPPVPVKPAPRGSTTEAEALRQTIETTDDPHLWDEARTRLDMGTYPSPEDRLKELYDFKGTPVEELAHAKAWLKRERALPEGQAVDKISALEEEIAQAEKRWAPHITTAPPPRATSAPSFEESWTDITEYSRSPEGIAAAKKAQDAKDKMASWQALSPEELEMGARPKAKAEPKPEVKAEKPAAPPKPEKSISKWREEFEALSPDEQETWLKEYHAKFPDRAPKKPKKKGWFARRKEKANKQAVLDEAKVEDWTPKKEADYQKKKEALNEPGKPKKKKEGPGGELGQLDWGSDDIPF